MTIHTGWGNLVNATAFGVLPGESVGPGICCDHWQLSSGGKELLPHSGGLGTPNHQSQ